MTAREIEYNPVYQAYDLFVPSKEQDNALPSVILLHALTSSRKSWLDIPQTIADATKRKVYALDARNHGESEWSEEFDFDVLARDVEKFMCDANISKAVLVGHSLGGKTAMVFALSWPEKVDKLVLEDISPKSHPAHGQIGFMYMQSLRHSLSRLPEGCDLETAKDIMMKHMGSKTPQGNREKQRRQNVRQTLALKMGENGVTWQQNMDVIENACLKNPKFQNAVEGIYNGQTLFIYGTNSPFGLCYAKDKIMEQFPNAVFCAIEDATHLVHIEFPEEFCEKVVEFIGI